MHSQSEALLNELSDVWQKGVGDYKEMRIRVGRMLHEYVLQGLREGDAIPKESERVRLGLTRQALVDRAGGRMGLKEAAVNNLIRCAAVVDLLSDGGYTGKLSYTSIRTFRAVIERIGKGKDVVRSINPRATTNTSCTVALSSKEEWQIRPKCTEWAAALFRRAVGDNWSIQRVDDELALKLMVRPNKSSPSTGLPPKRRDHVIRDVTPPNTVDIAQQAHPRDLAEMVVGMVLSSPDPDTVLKLVLEAIRKARAVV